MGALHPGTEQRSMGVRCDKAFVCILAWLGPAKQKKWSKHTTNLVAMSDIVAKQAAELAVVPASAVDLGGQKSRSSGGGGIALCSWVGRDAGSSERGSEDEGYV